MSEKKNLKEDILNKEIEKIADFLEQSIKNNQTPWRVNWHSYSNEERSLVHNPYTGTIYQGSNEILLRFKTLRCQYSTNYYLTFKNVKELGGRVKKGEEAATIMHFSIIPPDDEKIQEEIKIWEKQYSQKATEEKINEIKERVHLFYSKPCVKFFSVFNFDQCEDIDLKKLEEHQKQKGIDQTIKTLIEKKKFENIAIVEEILKNSKIPITHNIKGDAYYLRNNDTISLPYKESFKNEKHYYATALHELGHATGHQSRLNRFKDAKVLEEDERAQEELRVEIFSYLQGEKLSLNFDFEDHISYLKEWKKYAKDGIKEAVKDSFKMCDYVEKNWYPKELKQELKQEQKKVQNNLKEQKQTKSRGRGR